jgi:hypothetical protein
MPLDCEVRHGKITVNETNINGYVTSRSHSTGIGNLLLSNFTTDSAIGSDRLWAGQPGFNSWQGQDFFLLHSVTSSGAHPAFYPMGIGGPFPVGKAAGA